MNMPTPGEQPKKKTTRKTVKKDPNTKSLNNELFNFFTKSA